MLKSVYIVCLLLANFLPSQLSQGDSKEDEGVQDDSTEKKKGGLPKNVLSCSRNVSKPMIYSPSQEATIGWNVTLECVSQNGSPPINYTLYKGQNRMLPTVIKDKADDKALFNFTINSYDELGEYKCKVQNRCLNSSRYSTGFSFKAPKKDNAVVFIVSPLLLLIVLAVIISLLILWCRARKSKPTSSHAGSVSTYPRSCATCEKTGHSAYENEDVAYTEVKFDTKDNNYGKVIIEEDTTVNYAEVAIRK